MLHKQTEKAPNRCGLYWIFGFSLLALLAVIVLVVYLSFVR